MDFTERAKELRNIIASEYKLEMNDYFDGIFNDLEHSIINSLDEIRIIVAMEQYYDIEFDTSFYSIKQYGDINGLADFVDSYLDEQQASQGM